MLKYVSKKNYIYNLFCLYKINVIPIYILAKKKKKNNNNIYFGVHIFQSYKTRSDMSHLKKNFFV